jgi:hypothetical protein
VAWASPARGIAKKDTTMPVYQASAHFKELLKCYKILLSVLLSEDLMEAFKAFIEIRPAKFEGN